MLRRCLELARVARDGGNEPFGSLLVGADGAVLAELTTPSAAAMSPAIPSWRSPAGRRSTSRRRSGPAATLYTSCESSAMCAGGQYWAGIGRLVFALSGAQLAALAPGDGPTLRLPSREVFARGNVPIVVEGPCEELAAEAASVFEGFWPTS